jgi:hypothetical protein
MIKSLKQQGYTWFRKHEFSGDVKFATIVDFADSNKR